MEGGVDEELDYDVAEDFQDDDENNTFYHDQEEEEETKYQEVRPDRWTILQHVLTLRNKSRRNSDLPMPRSVIEPRSTLQMTRMMICLVTAN
jgi:hypothetical protein